MRGALGHGGSVELGPDPAHIGSGGLKGKMNTLRTTMLLAALTALFMGLGYLIGGTGGALIALVIAAGMNLFTYWNADKIVLRMHNAQEVDARSCPQLFGIVAELARRGGLPTPRVYLIDEPHPNAFATGRNPENAAVAATTGLLRILTTEEVAAVMAHELAHVKNRDTLIMTMTATIAGAISMLANFGLFFRGGDRGGNLLAMLLAVIVAPFAAMIVQLAISRTRESGMKASKIPMALLPPPTQATMVSGRRPSCSRHCARASRPMTDWNSRTMVGYGCGPSALPST